eukprot:gene22761-1366_t
MLVCDSLRGMSALDGAQGAIVEACSLLGTGDTSTTIAIITATVDDLRASRGLDVKRDAADGEWGCVLAELFELRAQALRQEQKIQEAIEDFKMAVDFSVPCPGVPTHILAHRYSTHATLLYQRGHYQIALNNFYGAVAALKRDGDDGAVCDNAHVNENTSGYVLGTHAKYPYLTETGAQDRKSDWAQAEDRG